uniref:FBA_2 domain-containing protein n=1 Tax=Caenorhabditis tropicalis TaxID=1561998 RepID=A0A1I7TFY3_9PELO
MNNISYDSLKSIIKHLSSEKRETIHCRIESLRSTNLLFPYEFETVTFSRNRIQIENRNWHFTETATDHNEEFARYDRFHPDGSVPSRVYVRFQCAEEFQWRRVINMSLDDACRKLMSHYFRNGTKINSLILREIPSFFKEQDSQDFKIAVFNLKFCCVQRHGFLTICDSFLSLIEPKGLKSVEFNSIDGNLEFLDLPIIKSCMKLILSFQWIGATPVNDFLFRLTNQIIYLCHPNFTIENVQSLAENWIESGRPIGTTFAVEIHDYDMVLDIFDRFKERYGAIHSNVANIMTSYHANSITIKLNNESELVVFGGTTVTTESTRRNAPIWSVNMQIFRSGTSVVKETR